MRRHFRPIICVVLCFALALPGCSAIRTRYHRYSGPRSAIKVMPYWEDSGGRKHVLQGAEVSLYRRDRSLVRPVVEAKTIGEDALTFTGLAPGKYVLTVFHEGREYAYEQVELLPGKRLTVRVDVASRAPHGFDDAVAKTATGLLRAGEFLVLTAAIVGIVYLYLRYMPERDDDWFERRKEGESRIGNRSSYGWVRLRYVGARCS